MIYMTNAPIENKRYISINEAIKVLDLSRKTLTEHCRAGEIEHIEVPSRGKEGFKIMMDEESLLAWYEDRKNGVKRTPKKMSEMNINDISRMLQIQISKAYKEGYEKGKSDAMNRMAKMMGFKNVE